MLHSIELLPPENHDFGLIEAFIGVSAFVIAQCHFCMNFTEIHFFLAIAHQTPLHTAYRVESCLQDKLLDTKGPEYPIGVMFLVALLVLPKLSRNVNDILYYHFLRAKYSYPIILYNNVFMVDKAFM
jgi:hypothetical protein